MHATRPLIGVSIIALALSPFATAGPRDLPTPGGNYGVGRRIVHWVDTNRVEVMSGRREDRREVTVYLWYPATQTTAPPAAYVADLDSLAKTLSRDEATLARTVLTHARSNAPVAVGTTRFPVVLVSPGSDSFAALYTAIAEELASRGIVVAGVDHPYDSRAVRLQDGRVAVHAKEPAGGEALLQFQHQRVAVRAADLAFVVDRLTMIDNATSTEPLAGRLDVAHIGAIGHSVGGMTAAEFCMRDSRATACANLDGVVSALPVYPDPSGEGPRQPFLFMDKPFPAMKGERPDDTARRITFLRQRGNATLSNVRQGHSYRITLPGATHATFSDEEVVTTNAPQRRALLDRVLTSVVQFFDETLRGASATLASQTATGEVMIDVFSPR